LPEGIDELLPEQAVRLEALRRRLLDTFQGWGYQLVITPFIEYLDSLLTGVGKDLDLQTFKLTDQLSGRMMGVRADITPQAARIDAHKLRREEPTRLCYIGSVLRTRSSGLDASRSPLQMGAELFGHSGTESDTEILCLLLETLRIAGIEQVYLDLGHVGIFRGLSKLAALSDEQEAALFDALQRKAGPEIDALIAEFHIAEPAAGIIARLAELNGDEAVIDQARELFTDAGNEVRTALEEMVALREALRARLPEVPVHYDLAELRGYGFHSGVTFAAFVPGIGQEIARGGRYDHIGEVFGRARPATGFSTDLKVLMQVGYSAEAGRPETVFAPWQGDTALEAKVRELRDAGLVVLRQLPGQVGDADSMGCSHKLEFLDGVWVLNPV
jgi:ATP phosphoribosyltransferase regulatory subunit